VRPRGGAPDRVKGSSSQTNRPPRVWCRWPENGQHWTRCLQPLLAPKGPLIGLSSAALTGRQGFMPRRLMIGGCSKHQNVPRQAASRKWLPIRWIRLGRPNYGHKLHRLPARPTKPDLVLTRSGSCLARAKISLINCSPSSPWAVFGGSAHCCLRQTVAASWLWASNHCF